MPSGPRPRGHHCLDSQCIQKRASILGCLSTRHMRPGARPEPRPDHTPHLVEFASARTSSVALAFIASHSASWDLAAAPWLSHTWTRLGTFTQVWNIQPRFTSYVSPSLCLQLTRPSSCLSTGASLVLASIPTALKSTASGLNSVSLLLTKTSPQGVLLQASASRYRASPRGLASSLYRCNTENECQVLC